MRRLLTRLTAVATLLVLSASSTIATAPAAAATPRVSYTQAQQQFMCTICHEPLNEARSSEATVENQTLQQLINQGDTMRQIKHEMVIQYGVSVLAVPPAHGFNLLVFIIPGVVIVVGIGVIAYTIPRWRQRARHAAATTAAHGPGPPLSAADARRLDAELARDR